MDYERGALTLIPFGAMTVDQARHRSATEADSRRGESPLGQDDHAMDALRYLIATVDEWRVGRRGRRRRGSG